ncbi:MAG: MATE family efflux transporter [Saccharofermentans sp.]|nr:MATE family efflux transporter [Saccharofermentans sp.]
MSKKYDMITGSLGDKIILYAIPLALTGILQQLFNAADVAVVGRFAGKEAMAAVGSNAPVINLLLNLFVGISLGSNVVIARSIGQGNKEKVSRTVHTSIVVALMGGVLLTVLGQLLAPRIVSMLAVPADVFDYSVEYLQVYLYGMPVILLYNFESAIFRSCGNTKDPLIALIISGIINVFLNVIFVCYLSLDVVGVALATVISNLISSAVLMIVLLRTDSVIKADIKKLAIHNDVLIEMLRIGIPSGIQGMVFSFANIIVQSAVNSLGTVVMAASSAAFNLEIFVYYIMNAFNQTCTTFVGQNFGAGNFDRCRKSLKLCLMQCFICTFSAAGLILIFINQLLSIFNTDPDVIASGRIRLFFIFGAYLLSFVQETLSGYLRGFGMSLIPAVCSIVGICGVRLTWIFFVFPLSRSFTTIMQVYPISLGLTAVFMVILSLIIKPSRKFELMIANKEN